MSVQFRNANRYSQSANLFQNSTILIPGGVNSTARAFWSGWDPHPIFIDYGSGSQVVDVDGNNYIDYLSGLGPMLLGHRHPGITAAVTNQIAQRGTIFALPIKEEAALAEKIVSAIPSVDKVRLCNSGTEADMYAVRLARAFTRKSKIIRFEGMYHGFSDSLYWSKHPDLTKAGPDNKPIPIPQGPGLPKGIEGNLIILPWNDLDILKETIERDGADIAAVITEPVMCNTACILPETGFLEGMREITQQHDIVLIFDEVVTGFRTGLAGAQGYYNIKPDLSVFAKGLGGGFPVAALGGRNDIMNMISDGTVSMSGTYNANAISVAAANATMDELAKPGIYNELYKRADRLRNGLSQIMTSSKQDAYVVGLGPMLQVRFTGSAFSNYRDAARYCNHSKFRLWWEGNLDRGILFHPGAYQTMFVTFAHNDSDIQKTLDVAQEVIDEMDNR